MRSVLFMVDRLKWAYLRGSEIRRDPFCRESGHIREIEFRRSEELFNLPLKTPGAAVRETVADRIGDWMASTHRGSLTA